jgi:hypothetical protein
VRVATRSSRRSDSSRNTVAWSWTATWCRRWLPRAARAIETALAGVVVAAVADRQLPHPSGELGRHVDDLFAVGDELLGEDSADPGGAFDRPAPLRPALGEAAQGPVALGAGWEPLLGERLATLVNGDGGVAVLVGVNPDQDAHGPPSGRDGYRDSQEGRPTLGRTDRG